MKSIPEEIKKAADLAFSSERYLSKRILERIWFRNILYYIGEQYIEWSLSASTFRRKATQPYLPTPVANIISDYVEAMKALILNREFTIRVWPNSHDNDDREASKLAEHLLLWMDEQDDAAFQDEIDKISTWTILCGVGFDRTYPDMGSGKHTGDIFTGEVASHHVLPFNMVLDDFGDTLRKKRYVGMRSIRDKQWVEDTFKTKVNIEEDDPTLIHYEQRLMKLVGQVSPWKGTGLEHTMADRKADELVILKELEFRPTKKYPKGQYVIQCGQKVLHYQDDLPIPTNKDGSWEYSFTDFHFRYVPGRFWSEPGVNNLISPQDSINQIDQASAVNRKGLGRPMVLAPIGVNLKRLDKFGQSLLVLEYDALLSGGQAPTIKSGTPLPQEFLLERSIHKETAQDSAGDPKHVLRGKPASSRSSGIQVDLLRDAAEQNHIPNIKRFYRSLKSVYRKRLILAKHLYSEERMIKVGGKEQDIRVIHLTGSNLRDNTDVRLELTNNLASTQSGRTQAMTQLLQAGLFGNLEQDPELRYQIMSRVGLGGIRSKNSVHVMRAERENSKILAGAIEGIFISGPGEEGGEPEVIQNDPLFKYDDHFVHYETHIKLSLSAEFETLPPEVQEALITHTDSHHMMMQAAAAQAMQNEIAMEQAKRDNKQQGTGNTQPGAPEMGGEQPPPGI